MISKRSADERRSKLEAEREISRGSQTHKLDQRTKPSGTSRDYQLASEPRCS